MQAVRFHVVQPVAASRDAVIAAVVDPRLYESMQNMPSLGPPSVLEHSVDGDVNLLRIRYSFQGRLSSAARAVLDPSKMTWVVNLEVDVKRYHAEFVMLPDHYADRIRCSGSYHFDAVGQRPTR